MNPYYELGPTLERGELRAKHAAGLLRALNANRCFSFIAAHGVTLHDEAGEMLIVDCVCDGVASHNAAKLRIRERLGIVCFHAEAQPEVLGLRPDFPRRVTHLQPTPEDAPASLCLYEEPWTTVRRRWTPEKYLQRILWWLRETADGTLHRPNEQIEPLHFGTRDQLIVAPDFLQRPPHPWALTKIRNQGEAHFFRLQLVATSATPWQCIPVHIETAPVVQGVIEDVPTSLAQLGAQLASRSIEFEPLLRAAVRDCGTGLSLEFDVCCLLTVSVPLQRSDSDATVVAYDRRAYLTDRSIGRLGQELGVLHVERSKLVGRFDVGRRVVDTDWGDTNLRFAFGLQLGSTPAEYQLRSGHAPLAPLRGVLAGVGALGSALANIWCREGWVTWTYVDKDHLRSHNVARHVAYERHVGRPKAEAVGELTASIYSAGVAAPQPIVASVTDEDSRVTTALAEAGLVLDATTTVEAPRELARRAFSARIVSVFLTPNGKSSVLLAEDADRRLRIDALEAQYYYAILNSEWGSSHLEAGQGHTKVHGCRSPSLIMPCSDVELHASILSQQVRTLEHAPAARAAVWHATTDGSVTAHHLPVFETSEALCNGWTVVLHERAREKMAHARTAALPNETGGIVVGFTDHISRSIMVVDVFPSPPDSECSPTCYRRGTSGVREAVDRVQAATRDMCTYVGEWHSHPAGYSAAPSGTDLAGSNELAEALGVEGEPCLMLIVAAEGDTRCVIAGEDAVFAPVHPHQIRSTSSGSAEPSAAIL